MKCRHCHHPLAHSFLDLGHAPPSNAYLSAKQLCAPELHYPLRVLVCEQCWLVQTQDHAGREDLFTHDYAYFSSMSTSWLAHAKQYVEQAIHRLQLSAQSHVIEVAANDGYLLQYVKEAGIKCLGIEPTRSTAQAAKAKGIEIVESFFGTELAMQLAAQGQGADLMVANNVLAHVPDINDFVAGFAALLKPNGVVTFEFPHVLQLIEQNQFDTVYHEHYSYLSLTAVQRILAANGLAVFDVETLPTHGGSLRVWAQRVDSNQPHALSDGVKLMIQHEHQAGLTRLVTYTRFQQQAEQVKNELLRFLLDAKQQGLKLGAYGAAAKGNTLLNFAGIRPDLLPYVVDKSPGKLGKYLPASHIPIVDEAHLRAHQPDIVLILPWNLRGEISEQLAYIRQWGGRFAVAVPKLEVFA